MASSCKKAPPKTLAEALSNATFPIFGASQYSDSVQKIGHRRAVGRVYFDVVGISSLQQAMSARPKYLIIPEDTLVREMIAAEIAQQMQNPDRPKIPLFFLRNEEFQVIELDFDAGIKKLEKIGLQNFKAIVRINQ